MTTPASGSPGVAPDASLAGLAHRRRPAAVIAVSGPDRAAFLQGQLTQDVRGLETGAARPAAGLGPRGKLLYFGWLAAEPDRLLLVLPSVGGEAVAAHLARYAAFQKATIADVTRQHALIGLYGPRAGDLALPERSLRFAPEGELAGSSLVSSSAVEEFERTLATAGSIPISELAAEALRIEAGRPRFGQDADETNLPDEVGLSAAIAPNKGCYVGQEVVARLRTYGRVARRLVGWRFPDGPPRGGTVFPDPEKPGHELGRVTSIALSPRWGAIGLGLAARDVADGAELTAPGPVRAIVSSLPFA